MCESLQTVLLLTQSLLSFSVKRKQIILSTMAVLISHEKISVAQSPTDMRKYFEYNRCLDFTSQYPLNAQRKSTIE